MSGDRDLRRIYLFTASHGQDFRQEREILHKEVYRELRSWCEYHKLLLVHQEIKWGGSMDKHKLQTIANKIKELVKTGERVIFLNITCRSLGMLPMDATLKSALHCLQQLLQICADEYSLYQMANAQNACNVVLVRDCDFVEDLMPEERQYFLNTHKIPQSAIYQSQQQLHLYQGQILDYSYERAGVDLDTRQLIVDIHPSFASSVLLRLQEVIKESLVCRGSKMPSPHDSLKPEDAHARYMLYRSQNVVGRDDVITQIQQYVSGDCSSHHAPLLLLGEAGSGKSVVMAKAVYNLTQQLQAGNGDKPQVFYHFTGVTPGSNKVSVILQRFLAEVTQAQTQSSSQSSVTQQCCYALSNDTMSPLVIFIDSIDKCLECPSQIMSWLPWKLPPQVKCILSLDISGEQHQLLQKREIAPHELCLPPLSASSSKEIVQQMLSCNACDITDQQLQVLLEKKGAENPLWLTLACRELLWQDAPHYVDSFIAQLAESPIDLVVCMLSRMEEEIGSSLFSAAVCLLVSTATGLHPEELRAILGQPSLQPASPFDEKDEMESLEKDEGKEKKRSHVSDHIWHRLLRLLRPYLQPYTDLTQPNCVMNFYHGIFKQAIYKKYMGDGEESDVGQYVSQHWHTQLANFFKSSPDINRKVEEYLYHLSCIGDELHLAESLSDWAVFDKLYSEEHSTNLLSYWRKAGGTEVMVDSYKAALTRLEEDDDHDDRYIALRYEHVAHIFLQAGTYQESLDLTTAAIKWEEKELGNRPERMVELYSLMAEIYDEKLKLNDFVSTNQLPDLRRTISYGRKSISLRKKFIEPYHKHKLALSLMKLAFSLESWEACGGDTDMTGAEAIEEGNQHIDTALEIFKDTRDKGHYAEALMTKGVLAKRGSQDQLKHYENAMEICRQVYGDYSLLTSRLYINIGIVYEDNKDFVQAYDYFCKWAYVSERVLGPDHPKTRRAKGVLCEPRYRRVAERLKEREQRGVDAEAGDEGNMVSIAEINQEVERLQNSVDTEAGEMENRELEEHENAITEELQQAINSILQRAIGELELSEELQVQAQNILHMVENRFTEGHLDDGSDCDDDDDDEGNDDDDDSLTETEHPPAQSDQVTVHEVRVHENTDPQSSIDSGSCDTGEAQQSTSSERDNTHDCHGNDSIMSTSVVDSNVLAEARCNQRTGEDS